MTERRPIWERVFEKLTEDPATGCWVWTARTRRGFRLGSPGYGAISNPGKGNGSSSAHIVVYEYMVGEVPRGLVLDHLCRNTLCCNPYHLDPVTQRVNILRGEGVAAKYAAQTHCKRGHPFEGWNLIVRSNGNRDCRTCAAASNKASQARKRNAQKTGALV